VDYLLGRHEVAGEHLQQSLALYRAFGNLVGEASVLDGLGVVLTRLGEPEQATRHLQRSLILFRGSGDREGEVSTLNSLGEAAHTAGNPADALAHHASALTLATEIAARAHYTHALTLYADIGMPDAEEVRGHLGALNAANPRPEASSHVDD
jgi:tetratricopeptide (TPR) repeat protein